MKQLTIAVLVLALAGTAWGLSFNAGAAYFSPSAVSGGGSVLFSLGAGKRVDDMVMVNVQLDYFNKSFTKDITTDSVTTSSGSIVNTTTRQVAYDHSVKYFPVTAGAVITLPMGMLIHPYVEGRVGFGFAHVSYSYNSSLYTIPAGERPESGTYSGFGWRLGGGARLGLGLRSALYGGVYYNGNTCSRDAGNNMVTDLKMSGLMIGAGLEISGF